MCDLNFSGNELNPLDWGWQKKNDSLEPIKMLNDPAPQKLLHTISCKCKKGCLGNCSCRKSGLQCTVLCKECEGRSCENCTNTEEDSEESSDSDADDS